MILKILVCFLILIILFLLFWIIRLMKETNKKERDLELLEMKWSKVNLDSIDAKLNPHLFKNILNSIQSHAYQSYYTIEKLSNVLDYVLYETQTKYVTPLEEIEFAKNLIEINKIKLSPLFDLSVRVKCDETDPFLNQKVMAPLISIDLIENAFKHGDIQNPEAFISILIEFKNGLFSLTVYNKISEKQPLPKSRSGFGNNSLEQRLQVLYKNKYKLEKFVSNDVHYAYLKINFQNETN